MVDQVTIRPGGSADVPAVLAMLDLASDWLVAQGRTGQWGTQRQSTNPRRQAQGTIWGESGGLHLAMLGGVPVGALVVGLQVDFAPPPPEPDLYVNLLVTDRRYAGRGIGARLLDHARSLARAAGIGLVRLDCYAGDDRKLVRYYESQGFVATAPLMLGDWPGQLMEQKLRP
ncbi:MAG TPA: GNAT family N-acetyltransferase [Pilimelia sp.]|nr:GNAT family N-acetyltransferase [Pilimelia sp.]